MKFYNTTIDLQCLLTLSNEKLSNCQKVLDQVSALW